jgi:hypothetical protein
VESGLPLAAHESIVAAISRSRRVWSVWDAHHALLAVLGVSASDSEMAGSMSNLCPCHWSGCGCDKQQAALKIYKVTYDRHTKFWSAYNRIWIGEAGSAALAEQFMRERELIEYPSAYLQRVAVTESNKAALFAFEQRKEALKLWQENMAAGVPNHPKSL